MGNPGEYENKWFSRKESAGIFVMMIFFSPLVSFQVLSLSSLFR